MCTSLNCVTKVYWKGSHSSIHICRQHTFAQSFLDSKHYALQHDCGGNSTHNDTIITQQKGLQCIWAAFGFGCVLCCMFNNAISLNFVCRCYVLDLHQQHQGTYYFVWCKRLMATSSVHREMLGVLVACTGCWIEIFYSL